MSLLSFHLFAPSSFLYELHMELAEWLVRRALELVSRVRRSARSSSMMRILHSNKNPSCNYVA